MCTNCDTYLPKYVEHLWFWLLIVLDLLQIVIIVASTRIHACKLQVGDFSSYFDLNSGRDLI